jgi:hypothetical protein
VADALAGRYTLGENEILVFFGELFEATGLLQKVPDGQIPLMLFLPFSLLLFGILPRGGFFRGRSGSLGRRRTGGS